MSPVADRKGLKQGICRIGMSLALFMGVIKGGEVMYLRLWECSGTLLLVSATAGYLEACAEGTGNERLPTKGAANDDDDAIDEDACA